LHSRFGFESNKKAKTIRSVRFAERIAAGLRFRRAGHHYIFYFPLENQIQIVGILHERMDHARHLRDAHTSSSPR